MTTFDDTFAAAAFDSQIAQFGESLVYLPRQGSPRTIQAIVDRHPPEPMQGVDESIGMRMEIEVYNSQSTGIASFEVDTGGDLVVVAARKGATDSVNGPKNRRIAKILKDTAGTLRFEVQ